MNVQCKECGRELNESEVRMVAHWSFCPDCFQKLLEKREKPQASSDAPDEGKSPKEIPPEISAPAKAPCSLCGRETEADLLKRVGIWFFCPRCSADMVARAEAGSPEDEEMPPGDADKETYDPDAAVPGAVAQVPPGFVRFVHCAGCGRRIPEGGSRIVEGKPYCPDCYYAGVQATDGPGESAGMETDAPSSGEAPPENTNGDED